MRQLAPAKPLRRGGRQPNPYILTPLTEGVGFYGRDSVMRFVRNTLSSPFQNVIVLFGQRRIGKTSVLYQLMRPAHTPPGFRPIFFDLQGRAQHRLGQVLYGLAREIARALAIEIPPREAFEDESYFQYGFLPRVYEALAGERLLVLVDEFDVLGGEAVPSDAAYNALFSYLQDLLIDEQRHLTFVFVVGRRLDELPSRIKATFKSAQCKRISVLDPEAAEQLVREPAADRVRYTDAAVGELLDLTAGHPYFLQLLCYELCERATRAGQSVVDAPAVDADLRSAAMELGMGGLSWFWDEFPPAERFILSAIAHITRDHEAASLQEIGRTLREHGVHLQGMELSTAPAVLVDWEIIEAAGRDAFRFRVPFLREWILRKHSLDQAKRELEQISARAVLLYESARRLHHAGDLEPAVTEYRRALAANPNHARAQLGLAQGLYESGRVEAATDCFERAFRLDPESARDGLIAAHRDLGSILENDGRFDLARPHYQRVLDISPEDPSARVRMRDSWRATAGAHLASGRWDKAMEAYREALRYMPDDEYLVQALATLEERHLEAEVQQRRREQMERAVLEARLQELVDERDRVRGHARQWLAVLVSIAGLVSLVGTSVLATRAEMPDAQAWSLTLAASLAALFAAYRVVSRRL